MKIRLSLLLLFCTWFNGLAYGEAITLIASTDNPSTSLHVLALNKFNELVKQYSNEEISIQIHYRDNPVYPAVRGEEVNANMVAQGKGNIDITVVAVGNAARTADALNVFTLPYIFPDFDSATQVFSSNYVNNDLNTLLAEKHGFRVIAWLIGGFRHMTNSQKPVKNITDINGLKIRTPQNRLMKVTYEAFGATVKPISWGQTFDALKSGEVDGQENPYSVIYDSKFWNANQKYLTTNGPFLWTGPMMINEKKFKSLTPSQQDAILKAGKEAAKYEWDWIEKENSNFIAHLKENGIEISNLTDKETWIERAKKLWINSYSMIGYNDAVKGKMLTDKILNESK